LEAAVKGVELDTDRGLVVRIEKGIGYYVTGKAVVAGPDVEISEPNRASSGRPRPPSVQ
jgi:hypothetical protein